MKTSIFFQSLADLLRVIENAGVPKFEYGVLDAGETLELSTDVYNQIKETPQFQAYESNGGSSYCYDDDEWEVQQ